MIILLYVLLNSYDKNYIGYPPRGTSASTRYDVWTTVERSDTSIAVWITEGSYIKAVRTTEVLRCNMI